MWTQVETVDDHHYRWGLIHTDPHPQVLTESRGYDAFGVIYPSTSTVEEPGGAWDTILGDYLAGRRPAPIWGWGELALHYPEQTRGRNAKRVDEVLSVLRAPECTEAALLEALRHGRGYAVRAASPEGHLQLTGFTLATGTERAGSGETLTAAVEVRVGVELAFSGSDAPAVRARLVRSGEVVLEHHGGLPCTLTFTDPGPSSRETGAWYRLLVDNRYHRLVSNPIFLRYRTGSEENPSP
jgi:hypothetical protein